LKQEDKYLSKLERFNEEEEFILAHNIENDITERALLYSLQVSVEISMDIVAMKVRDMGLKVEDDTTNIDKITGKGIISQNEGDFLRQMNGVRNFILKGIIIKIAEY
jgi:uncharacterized protein YutE (UPF0331/DUF86 family)